MKRAVIIIITILFSTTFSKAQIILDKLYNGEFAYEISAPEYVRMMPGFQSTPKEETPFKAFIDPNNIVIPPIQYIEGLPIDPETRQLEYS